LDTEQVKAFRRTVLAYYRTHGRHDLPWRIPEPEGTFDPYKIFVSELMLQQTQVPRVVPKFTEFIEKFPTVDILANAELADVLTVWSGLGYNRRAKFLWQAAQKVAHDHAGNFPKDTQLLMTLPGVGKNTAGAITAYAFNEPVVFIETNIRTVYIYHFLRERQAIADNEILELVVATLDKKRPRQWYWALMDYGTLLKQMNGSLNMLSKQYTKQSASRREVRGKIIRLLTASSLTRQQLDQQVNDDRLDDVLSELRKESMIRYSHDIYSLGQ
jgi:A/G-specific adenine glycosylase